MTTVSPEFILALRDAQVIAPELPQADAFDTLAWLEAYERSIVVPPGNKVGKLVLADYRVGTATKPDELAVYVGGVARTDEELADSRLTSGSTLLSADHATDPYKISEEPHHYISADHGTGGLARLLSQDQAVTSIVPLGRQTWNAAVAPDTHPIKEAMGRLFPGKLGFISLHGMYSGKLFDLSDDTEIHALVGLGPTPNEQSRQVAEHIVQAAADLDLKVRIGNDEKYKLYNPITGGYKLDPETGKEREGQLMAKSPKMTTNFAHRLMAETQVQVPSIQLELARVLRLIPSDLDGGWHRDRHGNRHGDRMAKAMGVHLGYLLAVEAVKAIEGGRSAGN